MPQIDFNNATPDEIINKLSDKNLNIPKWQLIEKDYDPTKHRINNDHTGREDKYRSNGVVDKASRIHIGLEKLLTARMMEFMFAIPVKRIYHNIESNETRQQIAKAMEAIYKYAHIDTENKKRGLAYFASCEIFTIWYVVKKPNTLYGFNSQYKLKCKTFSPMEGVELYPLFDNYDDMTAMSMQYEKKDGLETRYFFETYTSELHKKWEKKDGRWEEIVSEDIVVIGKIPGVYMWRQFPIFHGLSHLREEIEYTLSRNSDVIAYNSAPILKVTGEIIGKENKGETRRIFRLANGGDIGYVSWSQAIQALEYHVSTLLNLFWSQGQMPDISFEQMRSIGSIGYDARQTLLTDAHLKVGDESGPWIEALERESNVIKAFLKKMNTQWDSEIDEIEVEHVITPFIQKSEEAEISKWTKANGGKPILSQLESIQYSGLSADALKTLDQIKKEQAEESSNQLDSIMGAYR